MDLVQEILALLEAKFQGVRKDGLQHLAAAIGLQVADKEEAQAVVDKLTADKVGSYVTDWRRAADAEIKKANSTYEEGLRRKYDFKEKGATDPTPPAPQQAPKGGEGLTLEAIGKLIDSKLQGVQTSITQLNADKVAASRRELFVAKLDEAKVDGRQRDMMLRSFDRANTFATEDEFNSYLTELQGDITALQQERADLGLGQHDKPLFGAVNEQGVSAGVADYIKAQSESKPALSGKEV